MRRFKLSIIVILWCILGLVQEVILASVFSECPAVFKWKDDSSILSSRVDAKALDNFLSRMAQKSEDVDYLESITDMNNVLDLLKQDSDPYNQSIFLMWDNEIIGAINFDINYFPFLPEIAMPSVLGSFILGRSKLDGSQDSSKYLTLGVINLNFIIVPLEFRRLGVGTHLLWGKEGLVNIAKKHSINKIVANIPSSAKAAINFLQKNKFKLVGSQNSTTLIFELDLSKI